MVELQKVLHVDDDEDIRTIVGLALEAVGQFTVSQCSSGNEAVAKAPHFKPDLLLLDVMMPGMSGEETMQELRKLPGLEHVPVVFMTAKVQDDVSAALLELGAIEVIAKPFDPVELSSQLRAAWSRHQSEL